jgi:hypothetical protein
MGPRAGRRLRDTNIPTTGGIVRLLTRHRDVGHISGTLSGHYNIHITFETCTGCEF